MEEGHASLTARVAALHRALESEQPADRRICFDQFARQFVGRQLTALGEISLPQNFALGLHKLLLPGLHNYHAIRTIHIDECVRRCLRDGIRQLVILGAGYDSRAYRIEELKGRAVVFEVDHPATQCVKLEKLIALLGVLPAHVRYVDINFNTQSLENILSENGYDKSLKTLFIWEGVTYYISAEAVDRTLAFVRDCSAGGSSIIFDYIYPEVFSGSCERREAKFWVKYGKRIGEALTFGIEKKGIQNFLAERGFSCTHNADSEWLNRTYFTNSNRHRKMSPIFAIVHAAVETQKKEGGKRRCLNI